VRIHETRILISHALRKSHFIVYTGGHGDGDAYPHLLKNKRVRVFYDHETKLIGFKSDDIGYKLGTDGSFRMRIHKFPVGTYKAEWDEEQGMVITDLNSPITKYPIVDS